MQYKRLVTVMLGAFLALLFAASVHARLTAQEIRNLQTELDTKGATFTVGPNPATERDISELCGLVPPDNWWVGAPFREMRLSVAAPPEPFNWCDEGACPPIRNQGPCGSCWAFATVGPLESNILIEGGEAADLSEQYLVSCTAAGNCGGGWWAHDYHMAEYPPGSEGGAVPEDEFPYVAWNAPCGGPYSHPWKIESWSYVNPYYNVPPVDEIKQAIIDYGPVTVAIYVGSEFQAYGSDIFNTNQNGTVNHGVVLVGWDDNQGSNGIWILRNSWGTGWGEGGYMRIEYGTSQVGYSANYIVYSTDITADFTGELTEGPVSLTVDFTDQSTGNITSWSWDLGDDSTSEEQHPTHTYDTPGTYTVSLTVSGPGGPDTETKTDFISATQAPRTSIVPALIPLGIP